MSFEKAAGLAELWRKLEATASLWTMVVVKEISVSAAEFAVLSEMNNINLLNVEGLETFVNGRNVLLYSWLRLRSFPNVVYGLI